MQSLFNQVFETVVLEQTKPQQPLSQKVNISTNTPVNSTNTTNVSTNTISKDTSSPVASGVEDVNLGITDTIQAAVNIAPEMLKNLKASAKFWSGKAGNGVDLLIQGFEAYNDKKRLNALHGLVDYMKAKTPILDIDINPTIQTIQKTLQQNEK